MKMLLGLLVLTSFSVHAQSSTATNCQVARPCQHSAAGNLGYCIASAHLKVTRGRGHMIITKKASPTSPAIRGVNIPLKTATSQVLEGSNHNGDDWFALDIFGNKTVGMLTLEQDFGFAVSCDLK